MVVSADAAGMETVKILTTDYTVSLNADQNTNPGGSVVMVVAPIVGVTTTLASQVANLQPTDITNGGGFYPAVITTALDRHVIQTQQLAEKLSRSMLLPISTPQGVSANLPAPVPLAFFGWNAVATAIVTYTGIASAPVTPYMATVTSQSTQSAALAALGLSAVVYSVKKYGAVGDGIADDTATLQACADAVRLAGGGVVYIPAGTYLINKSIAFGAKTLVRGDGGATIIKAKQTGFLGTLATNDCYLFKNYNWSEAAITDANIFFEDLTFDFGTLVLAGGGLHAVSMRKVQTAKVTRCVFWKGEDATAMLGCNDTHVDSCYASGYINCAWDHWTSPKNARVTNCYAEATATVQMVNFNPENTTGSSTGNVADGFIMSGNQFVYNGASASPCQLEPLATGTSVKNVIVKGNYFNNTLLVMRGAVSDSTIDGNIFTNISGNKNVFVSYPFNGGTPSNIGFHNNNISGATTQAVDNGVITIRANGYNITGNTVSGASFYAALDVSTYIGVVGENSFSTGTSGKLILGTGWQPVPTGVTFTNSWIDYGGSYKTTSYWKDRNNVVHLCLAMKTGTMSTAAFTLPSGFRPLGDLIFPASSNSAFGSFQVSATGQVTPTVGSNAYFFSGEVTYLAVN